MITAIGCGSETFSNPSPTTDPASDARPESGVALPDAGVDAAVDASGRALEPVNAGKHEGSTRMLSFGVRLAFDRAK